jgi:predicted DsbA family dithiol-disulfide isomerase
MGAIVGLEFNFESIQWAPNTSLSHQLIALTPEAQQGRVTGAIYEAYFRDGLDIGAIDILVEIAAAQGLDKEKIIACLRQRTAGDRVEVDVQEAGQLGIQGVPFFIINQKYALSGAQPPEAFAAALQRISNDER